MSQATLTLLILVSLLVFGSGSCVFRAIVGAAPQSRKTDGSIQKDPVDGDLMVLAPFQRLACWTTVSTGANSRHPLGSVQGQCCATARKAQPDQKEGSFPRSVPSPWLGLGGAEARRPVRRARCRKSWEQS